MDLAISPSTSIIYLPVEAPDDEEACTSPLISRSFKQVSSHNGIITRPFYYTNIDVDPKNPEVVYAMSTGTLFLGTG